MKLVKLFKWTALITVLAVSYIHMQMRIFDLAYQGKAKEKQIRQLIEENGNLTYRILTLKSADNLGIQLLAEDSNMEFVDPQNIVHLQTPAVTEEISLVSERLDSDKKTNRLLSLLSQKIRSTSLLGE